MQPLDMFLNKLPLSGEISAAVEALVCLADLYKSVEQRLQPVLCSGFAASRLEPSWESGGDPSRKCAHKSLPDARGEASAHCSRRFIHHGRGKNSSYTL